VDIGVGGGIGGVRGDGGVWGGCGVAVKMICEGS